MPGLVAGLAFFWLFLFVKPLGPLRGTMASVWIAVSTNSVHRSGSDPETPAGIVFTSTDMTATPSIVSGHGLSNEAWKNPATAKITKMGWRVISTPASARTPTK